MRISTNQVYERGLNSLMEQQIRVSDLNHKVITQIRVEKPSDDPIAAAQIELMTQRIYNTMLLQKNCQTAISYLSLEEKTLDDSANALQRLREIQIQAGDGALSQKDRQSLAVEAQNLLNQISTYANATDNDGNYMFGGGQTSRLPFTLNGSGQYVYNGDSTQRFQAVSSNLQIPLNDTGDNIFMRIPNGNGTFAIRNPATPNTGTASLTTGSVLDPTAYVPDNYTMNFALNSQGNLVVMVTGATSGNVIPPTGLVDDAPLYQDGMAINFNGMSISAAGAPQAGDSFSISPSQNDSIFSTIQTMIDNLNQPYVSPAEKAATYTMNNQLLAQLDSALDNIINFQADIGARLNQLDFVDSLNEDLLGISTETWKQLRETDPIKVVTEYNEQLVNLEAAQKSFVRLQGLSVFNYI